MQQQGGLARRRRALERRAADADDRAALRERRKQLRQPLGAGDGVELVAALGEPRRRVQVVVGAERDDQEVGLVDAAVGGHAARLGIDRGDRLLQKPHPGLYEVAVWDADRIGCRPAEHHVELRIAEDERVALVDQRHVDVSASASDSIVASSRPPKPAPRMSTRVFTGPIVREQARGQWLRRTLAELPRPPALARRDVLVDPEEVVRVVLLLQRLAAGRTSPARRPANPLRTLVTEEVHVHALVPRLQRRPEAPHPLALARRSPRSSPCSTPML